MARQPARTTPPPKKKRRLSSTLLWGGIGLVILLLGLASALYYMNRDRLPVDNRLKVVREFMDKLDTTIERGKDKVAETLRRGRESAQRAAPPPEVGGAAGAGPGAAPPSLFGGGSRTYTVQAGDTLWSIARDSGLVATPWDWPTIVVQNRDKIDYAFVSRENGGWKIVMNQGERLTVDGGEPFMPREAPGKRYTVQLASLPGSGYRRGVFIVRILVRDGYFAYLYRTDVDGRTVYRLRSGFYESEARAKDVGKQIRERYARTNWFSEEQWVLVPSAEERRGDMMDFGIQRINPFVVEVSERHTHAEALRDLRKLNARGEFAYISQDRNPLTRRFVYHTRIGYFPTEDEARHLIDAHDEDLWSDAKVVQVDYFQEAFPGQPARLGDAGS